MMLNTEQIVKLLQVSGVGKTKVFKLSEMIDFTPTTNIELAELLMSHFFLLKISPISRDSILNSFNKAEDLLYSSQALGIKTYSFFDSNFPPLLKKIKNPPIIINVQGNITNLITMPTVAVIGTREPSDFGRKISRRIGTLLGMSNINVVSGLAKGCDTAAHVGCLESKGKTTAVLAHGLDMIYPSENKNLAKKILDLSGCLVSEYMIKTRAISNYFIERDRIQAGLSISTIVIETDIKGGTMHTVNYTLDYDRMLVAINHPTDKLNDKSRGNQYLIAEKKAISLENSQDIEKLIAALTPNIQRPFISVKSIPIAEVLTPLFNDNELEKLLMPPKEKFKKSRKKRSKPNSIQTKAFNIEPEIETNKIKKQRKKKQKPDTPELKTDQGNPLPEKKTKRKRAKKEEVMQIKALEDETNI